MVDIEDGKEKLEIIGAMAKRMWKASGYPCEIHLTLDHHEALKNADFVTTQFRVGLMDARIKDERIPLSHGIIGQETNGAGGIFKAFRTIPVILDIIKDMKELCPNAWLINFTNPSGIVTEAAIKYGGWKKTVGLCNVPIRYMMMASEALDIPVKELNFKFAGLNHFHWHRVWDKEGNERTNEIIELVYNPNSTKEFKAMPNIENVAMLYEQIKDLGILPCPYHRYYYASEEMLKHQLEDFANGETRAEVVKRTEAELFELYKDPKLNYKPEQLTKRGGTYYSDAACEIINSIYNDKSKRMVVSIENKGSISDLPYDYIVEVSAVITSNGPEPLTWGEFDPAPRALLQHMKGMEETVIEAAVTGDYNKALHAFILNPLVPNGKITKILLDEMLVAHKKYLPQFAKKIAEIEAHNN